MEMLRSKSCSPTTFTRLGDYANVAGKKSSGTVVCPGRYRPSFPFCHEGSGTDFGCEKLVLRCGFLVFLRFLPLILFHVLPWSISFVKLASSTS